MGWEFRGDEGRIAVDPERVDITKPTPGSPTRVEGLPDPRGARAERGRLLVAQAGCLACHLIGSSGNDGPGPGLTRVGAALPEPAIRRALVDPEPPMPSYESIGDADLDALVAYLAQLR